MKNLSINSDRLWGSLMEMAMIGATKKGGNCRLALSDSDKDARDLFVSWCKKAGCLISVDAIGNIFARRPGKNASLSAIMAGSHLDTQPTGGRFDGVLGVLSALEVVQTLNDQNISTDVPIDIVCWTNEEGSRFAPSMMGSGVHAGVFNLESIKGTTDAHGILLGTELERIGYAGSDVPGSRKTSAYFELHIEQGPILEKEKKTIGIVTGAQGQKWLEVKITGIESHAGPTPMSIRKDALVASAEIVLLVNSIGNNYQPGGCATCGVLEITNPSRNVIPGNCFLTIDFRHPNDNDLKNMDQELRKSIKSIEKNKKVKIEIKQILELKSNSFNNSIVNTIKEVSNKLEFTNKEIISGAGHDAVNINTIAPTAMIFIPCIDGISHNEIEDIYKEDAVRGTEVLLHSIIELANNSSKIINN